MLRRSRRQYDQYEELQEVRVVGEEETGCVDRRSCCSCRPPKGGPAPWRRPWRFFCAAVRWMPHVATVLGLLFLVHLFSRQGLRPLRYLADCRVCQSFVYSVNHITALRDSTEAPTASELLAILPAACDRADTPWFECRLFALMIEMDGDLAERIVLRTQPEVVCVSMWFCTDSCCTTRTQPEQVHLALTLEDDRMNVMWMTEQPTPPSSVVWSRAGSGLHLFNRGVHSSQGSDSFTAADATQSTFWKGGWEGVVHSATMHSLLPNASYEYVVGSFSGWSKVLKFRTPARCGAALRLLVVADMGADACSDSVIRAVESEVLAENNHVDLVVHNGDIAYSGFNEYMYDAFMRKVEAIASRVPYMVVVGNHEFYRCFSSYRKRYSMPSATQHLTQRNPFWWSKRLGDVHIIAYSTESELSAGSEQLRWVEDELRGARSSGATWILMFGHRMTYCSTMGSECGTTTEGIRAQIEPLVQRYGVDMVINAHQHSYERTLPVFKAATRYNVTDRVFENPGCAVYVNIGIGGAESTHDGYGGCDLDCDWQTPRPPWSAVRTALLGYGSLTISNHTLVWEARDARLRNSFDTITIRKKA